MPKIHDPRERDIAKGLPQTSEKLPYVAKIQQSFGQHQVQQVGAQIGGAAAQANQQMGSEAFAAGNHVAFAQTPDLHTAAHEAAHVVQQRQGVAGKSPDAMEQQADRVAELVVSGQSAEATLGSVAAPQQAPAEAVQFRRKKKHKSSQVSVPDNTNPTTGSRAQYKHRKGPKDGPSGIDFTGETLEVADNEGVSSNALNPAFEADALSFEKNLGNDAANKGNGVATQMCGKVDAYMQERGNGLKDACKVLDTGLDQNYSLLGTTRPEIAGAVGQQVDDIKAVISQGNIRERMTLCDMFTRNVLSPDIAGTSQAEAKKWAKEAGLHHKKISKAITEYNKTNDTADPNSRAASKLLTPAKGIAGEHQKNSRIANRDKKSTLSNRKLDSKTKADGSGPGLSAREKKLAIRPVKVESGKMGLPEVQNYLAWAEGARSWFINEKNKWVQEQRKLSMPLKAGPSGTTQRLMGTAQILKVGPSVEVRLACIGYLLPIRAHSLVEVMTGAQPFGLPFVQGQKMYTKIAPYSKTALRKFGKNGKFPHETSGDK